VCDVAACLWGICVACSRTPVVSKDTLGIKDNLLIPSRWCLSGVRSPSKVQGMKSIMVVLGSGGHTAEMLSLVKELDLAMYSPIHLVVAATDSTSIPKLNASNPELANASKVHLIRRSREVGQSFSSSVITTVLATIDSVMVVIQVQPHLILMNGPGTCLPICVGGILQRCFFIGDPCIVYVESFCRVKSLSLTGKIVYHLADKFIVNWPQLLGAYPRAKYIGTIY